MNDAPHDRRKTARRDRVDDHGIVSARVRPGHEAAVVDVSAGGALVETGHRLLPGSVVELHLESPSRRATVRGRVLRCAVSRLGSSSVRYRGAIGFDRHLHWFAEADDGYGLHADEKRPGVSYRAETTPNVL